MKSVAGSHQGCDLSGNFRDRGHHRIDFIGGRAVTPADAKCSGGFGSKMTVKPSGTVVPRSDLDPKLCVQNRSGVVGRKIWSKVETGNRKWPRLTEDFDSIDAVQTNVKSL